MTRKLYDKLVRDRIPEIIPESGSTCGTETIEEEAAFRRALRDKLVEEASEARSAADAELATELGDLQEVIDALIDAYGLTHETVRRLQQQRRQQRGSFTRRLRLLWTE